MWVQFNILNKQVNVEVHFQGLLQQIWGLLLETVWLVELNMHVQTRTTRGNSEHSCDLQRVPGRQLGLCGGGGGDVGVLQPDLVCVSVCVSQSAGWAELGGGAQWQDRLLLLGLVQGHTAGSPSRPSRHRHVRQRQLPLQLLQLRWRWIPVLQHGRRKEDVSTCVQVGSLSGWFRRWIKYLLIKVDALIIFSMTFILLSQS